MNELCTACKKQPRKIGFKRCDKCLEYFREYRAKNNVNKCTSCGGERDSNKKTCNKCLNQKKVSYTTIIKSKRKEIKEDRNKNNICTECGKNEQTKDTLYCEYCLNKHKIKRKNRRKVWVEKGLCTNCGNLRENPTLLRCLKCNCHRKRTHLRRKVEVLHAYGNRCYCCDLNQLEFLTIDHINGGGVKHRKQITSLYGWLKKNNYPDGFRAACINCNTGRSRNNRKLKGGSCPHKDKRIIRENIFITPYTQKILLEGKSNRRAEIKLRFKAINAYGRICECCGVDQYEFLSLDHVLGGGRKHIESIKGNIYSWAKKNNYPSDLRLLCLGCNQGREINGGECPHKCKLVSYEGFSLTQATYESLIWNT